MKFSLTLAAAAFLFSLSALDTQQILERNDAERQLFDLLNNERTSNDLPKLGWDDALFKAARRHALLMLNLNSMEHELPGEPGLAERLAAAGARFSLVAENIAIGGNPRAIHEGWMNSPGHRRNILDRRVTAVGIAAVRGNGGLFTVEDFSKAFVDLSAEQQEKQVTALLAAKGYHVAGRREEARKACEGRPDMPALGSIAVLRFETSTLEELPIEVEKKLRSESLRNAAVGACRSSDAPGFSSYHIVVLFF